MELVKLVNTIAERFVVFASRSILEAPIIKQSTPVGSQLGLGYLYFMPKKILKATDFKAMVKQHQIRLDFYFEHRSWHFFLLRHQKV